MLIGRPGGAQSIRSAHLPCRFDFQKRTQDPISPRRDGGSRLRADASGEKLNGANRYTLRFAPGQLPPVNAFWSITMYELPASLLYANPLNRYLINSPMLRDLKRDADGGFTLYIQHESPGKDHESNWLPAPEGAFYTPLRLYWPKAEALSGSWKQPPLQRSNVHKAELPFGAAARYKGTT